MKPMMDQEVLFDGKRWGACSQRRRFRIGDLMVTVAMTALGLSAISLPDLTSSERLFLGVFALAFLGLLWTQWGLASIPLARARPGINILVGFLSSLMALSMFICLILMGLVFPQGAALLSLMMLILGVYLTTWE